MGDTETFKSGSRRRQRFRSTDKDDFPSMFTDLFAGIQFKVAFFLFLVMIFVFSDVYVDLVLTNIDGAVYGDMPTTKGSVIQITFVTICYIIIDLLVQGKFL